MKRMLSLCAAALCLTLALTPTALAADFEPAVPDAKVCYPTSIVRNDDGTELKKIYDLSPEDDPAGIPRSDFRQDGFQYTLTDLLKQELPENESRQHTEHVSIESAKKDMESVLALLPQEREFITDDGLMGTLTLRLDTVQVEPSGYGSSTKEISTKRSYPNLAEQDTQYIPKSIEDNGKTLTLSDIQWQTDNTANMEGYAVADRYTAVATYTGSATSSYVKGYTVTADYTGTVSRIALNRVRYWFDGCTSLAIAEVPYTTPLIGERAFADCPSLTDLFLYYQDESDFTIIPGAFAAVEPVDTNVYVVADEQTAIINIILYGWKSDNRQIHLMDAYAFRSLADCGIGLCNCTNCDWYYSYSSNGSATHAQWVGCTTCSAAFWLKDVSHSMRGNTCTVCGYTAACSHPTTKTTWSGCKWYDYCRTCGKLVASGTSHGTFIYGNWEYYTISQHRQSYVCSDCRASFYRYGSHSTTTQYTQYDDTQHQVSEYCSVCAYAIASAYADHHDDDGDGACDDCGYLTARFSVTVPVSLIITVSESGEVFVADNAAIVNNSTGPVAIKEITLTAENGWSLVPFTTNMATEKVDSKQIGFEINGAQSSSRGEREALSVDTGPIAAGEVFAITYDAVISASSEAVDEQVLTVVFVVGWAE